MEFRLSDSFLEQYKTATPDWGPLGEFVYLRTYSRKVDGENRNEQWWETVRRVVEGVFSVQKTHCHNLNLPWKNDKAQKSAQLMFRKMFEFKFLPSGRNLWMMGTDFVKEKGGTALLSCSFISTEDIKEQGANIFSSMMDLLMLGVGAGFDTKGADKLLIKAPKPDGVFVIPDEREGWVESVRILLDAFFTGKSLPTFDYSLIRPAGAPIRGFGGTASGPGPLIQLHKNLEKLLTGRVGQMLSSVDIVDIENFISVCVIAGNVRRSAAVAIGEAFDYDYITMKDYKLHPVEVGERRWGSNNSVFAEVGKTDYKTLVDSIALNGEPGIVWLDNMQKYSRTIDPPDNKDYDAKGCNACAEITLQSKEFCNLVETFPSRHDSYEEYEETLKMAYLYGKSVTLIPTHLPDWNAVMLKNRRIGVSMSGIIDAFGKHGRRELLSWCDKGYGYIQKLDAIYSDWLCIPRSRKTTTVKPSGSVSLLPGVSPGIHYPHAEYYIRRVRVAKTNGIVLVMKVAGYTIEEDAVDPSTVIIEFPVHEEYFLKSKEDATIWEQCKNVVDLQRHWADNNVSVTVTFNAEERGDIVSVLEAYEDSLKTISFLPLSEHGYAQAPYEEISKEQYEEMTKNLSKPDFSSITSTPIGSKFCDGDSCELR